MPGKALTPARPGAKVGHYDKFDPSSSPRHHQCPAARLAKVGAHRDALFDGRGPNPLRQPHRGFLVLWASEHLRGEPFGNASAAVGFSATACCCADAAVRPYACHLAKHAESAAKHSSPKVINQSPKTVRQTTLSPRFGLGRGLKQTTL